MQSQTYIGKVDLRRFLYGINYDAFAGQLLEGFLLVFEHADMAHRSFEPFLKRKPGFYINRIAKRILAEHV